MDEATKTRYAEVLRFNGRPPAAEVEKYLPANYRISDETDERVLIEGEDNAGWTLEDYVIPRLGSGWITAREVPAP